MSTSGTSSAQVPANRPPKKPRRDRRETARAGALVTVAVLITLFAVFNTDDVKIDWIFGHTHAPLIIVIVVSLLVGIVLTYFAERSATARSRTGKRR